jgi:hydrogenase nickel incorporation protein HypB
MCKDCGCGLPGEHPSGISAQHSHDHEHEHAHTHEHSHGEGHTHTHGHAHRHSHEHDHDHAHSHEFEPDHPHAHDHGHGHSHPHDHEHEEHSQARRTLELKEAILGKNDRVAERNRGFFQARGLLVLNILSSPGSGKTSFVRETIRGLGSRLKTAVIVGDLATDKDAQRLRETGAAVVQITTGTVCHLEAEMVARAVRQLDLNGVQLLIIENVGNLVCPASYDLGENLRVVLLSVTEGEDKPLKYPPMFQLANAAIVSKIDLAKACDYDRETALANLRRAAPQARVFETSAKTGQGLDAWLEFLLAQHRQYKQTAGESLQK